MTDEDLLNLYKSHLEHSLTAALRALYETGKADGAAPHPASADEPASS